jgi:predicted transcriptional regulator
MLIGDAPAPQPQAVVPENVTVTPQGGVQFTDPNASGTPPAPETLKTPETPERPTWLPEKFKTPEDLAKAYGELESKLGAPKPETPAAQRETPPTVDLASAAAEFLTNEGKLSDETVAALAAKGITPAEVSTYAEGQKALGAQVRAEFAQIAGGEENLKATLSWAKANLTPAEIKQYDAAIQSGNADLAKLLFQGIAARFTAAAGTNPTLLTGGNVPASGGETYESWDQVTRDMGDPRYKTDPAFQRKVQTKLLRSPI